MGPERSTWVDSTTSKPAPEFASIPRCVMCQSLALPSSALYWHIGETTMRLASVRLRNVTGEKSELGMDLPGRERARHTIAAPALPATAAMEAGAARNVALARPVSQHRDRRIRHRAVCVSKQHDQEVPRLQLWRKSVQAGPTQGSRPPRGLSGRRGRAADRITADVSDRAKLN